VQMTQVVFRVDVTFRSGILGEGKRRERTGHAAVRATLDAAGRLPLRASVKGGEVIAKCRLIRRRISCSARRWIVLGCGLWLGLGSCDSLNPAFVGVLDPDGTGMFATMDNARGHVVIAFVNNTQVDERLVAFMEADGSLNLTPAEKQALKPRMRLRVQVTFTDGSAQTIEFIDGSRNLVDRSFDAEALPDLNQNDLSNAVVVCDVASVLIEPGTDIEVFIPVPLEQYGQEEVFDAEGNPVTRYTLRGEESPRFRRLEIDEADEDGNVTVQHNIGRRDAPSPAMNPLCGSVVAIVVDGVLAVPFLDEASSRPSYNLDDNATVSRIGGRYEFRVTVQ